MPINTRLEADCRRNLFEPPTRGSRLYFARVGGRVSSSDTLGAGGRKDIVVPSTKLGKLPQLHDTDTTSTPDRQSVPAIPAAHIPSGFDAKQKPSSGHF
jgi:hypothetical protein